MLKRIIEEYRISLKDTAVEEVVDLILFRPIAFVLVKAMYPFPISPNQISVLSMLAGIVSGVFYAFGNRQGFLLGGLFYGFAHVLDCCDGMIARLKNGGTPIGRIVDGWTDYVTGTAVYIGLLIGLFNSSLSLPTSPWILMIPAALGLILHSMVVDYYRLEFLAHALGKATSIREDMETFSQHLEQLKKEKSHYLEILLLTFYVGYTKIQVKHAKPAKKYPRDEYYFANKRLVFLWNWIGAATHIFVLMVASVLYEPSIFFFYILGLANVWMVVMGLIQIKTNRQIVINPSQAM